MKLWILLALLLLSACGKRPGPTQPTERVLFRDLERLVTVAATTGWGIDRLEIENMLETTLDSTCRVDPLTRRSLATWLTSEIEKRGGPVDKAWRERGKKLSKVDDLLVLTRIQMLLARAEEVAHECPFWIEPEDHFRGRQISERKFQLLFSGGGKGIAIAQGNDVDISAGGAGRLLLGRMFEGGHGFFAGIEIGGSAAFPKDAMGMRTALELAADIVFPLVVRRTFTNSYIEFEGGYLTRTTERDWSAYDHGIHVGVSFGARSLRQRFVFPGVAFGISYERILLDGDDLRMIKVGARVALDLDLF